jgi:hypothetical protein
MLIAAIIYNMSLAETRLVASYTHGIEKLIDSMKSNGHIDTDEQEQEFTQLLVETGEVYIDVDHDNQYTYALGIVE